MDNSKYLRVRYKAKWEQQRHRKEKEERHSKSSIGGEVIVFEQQQGVSKNT